MKRTTKQYIGLCLLGMLAAFFFLLVGQWVAELGRSWGWAEATIVVSNVTLGVCWCIAWVLGIMSYIEEEM